MRTKKAQPAQQEQPVTPVPEEPAKRAVNPQVLVAVVGVAGTVVAAFITAYFGFMTTRTQIALPIAATQTAEASMVGSSPTPTLTATPLPTETPTTEPTATPTVQQDSLLEWEQVLEFEHYSLCDSRVLPADIDQSNRDAAREIAAQLKRSSITTWPLTPFTGETIAETRIIFDVTNISDLGWIELSKTIGVAVEVEMEGPDSLDAVRLVGCGGAAEIREFTTVSLTDSFSEFSTKTEFPDADYFTLQPGEFERFLVPFTCEAPGYYRLTLNLDFRLRKNSGIAQTTASVVCPLAFTLYEFDTFDNSILSATNYTWDGTAYVTSP